MKNKIHLLSVIATSLILTSVCFADKNPDGMFKSQNTNKSKAEACTPATGNSELNINNVRARINTGGDMWWDLQSVAKYYVPGNTKKTSMFSGSLWIGGVDVNGQLKLAALRYRQIGNDYWPGPLTTDGTAAVDAATCKKFDKHFVITRAEVAEFLSHCDPVTGAFVPSSDYTIPLSIMDWPAHGDPNTTQSHFLAPFFDRSGDGDYDPNDGDYPYYDLTNKYCGKRDPTAEGNGILVDQVLKGDQTLWWVFNDKGNVHTETNGQAIGLEIRAQAFAFATNDEINNMTFYSYEIINRSTYRLTETYFSQWVDTDLGYAKDDFVGCDVKRGLGYCYNGKAIDGSGQAEAYGAQPPAIGVDFFQGPYMDKDGIDNPKTDPLTGQPMCDVSINGVNFGNTVIDDERFGMRRFVYHNNSAGVIGDPDIAPEYYNYLRGIWKDGVHMMWGGDAHSSGTFGPECNFMFPGDTDPCYWGTNGLAPNGLPYWTEETANNQSEDRRFMQSAGPFTLEPGAVNYITVGIPWARATSGGPFASVELLRLVDDKCQALFDNCFKVVDGPDAPELTIQELDKELVLYLTNPPISNNYKERYEERDPNIVSPIDLVGADRYDSTYNFEGYQIFQIKDASVSVSDIHDPDKARLVAQCDVKNNDKWGNPVDNLVNYYLDENSGGNMPVLEVQGSNTGIVHSFKITNDEFATGDKRLVNHKQYYYIAIAYAQNIYMKYSQEPGSQVPNVSGLTGQKKPYLAGRKSPTGSIKPVTGIPHNPSPEANGTIMHAIYGSGPKISRIEGQGNGGLVLDLTQATTDQIMSGSPWKKAVLEYQNNKGPLEVKVIDPLNVKKGDYKIRFDSIINKKIEKVSNSTVNTGGDTATTQIAYWTLTDLITGNEYHSDTTTLIGNEQLFLDLGFSVKITQAWNPGLYKVGKYTDINNQTSDVFSNLAPNNGFLEASVSYADSSQQWLSGVPDEDGGAGASFNWIRSGTAQDNNDATNNDYDVASGTTLDPNSNFEKILNGTFAPYRLASKYVNGPAWPQFITLNKFSNIASIDLVITPDQSKWTHCPIIEMCEDVNSALAEGGAKKFDLRKGQSVGKDGFSDGSGTGMGWFPGYVINVETGERLNMMFGEDSWLIGENGRDMKWNPTKNLFTDLYFSSMDENQILFGGKHYIYIMGHNGDLATDCPAYDEGAWLYSTLNAGGLTNKKYVYSSAIWTGIPLATNKTWLSNEVKIRIRVSKPYAKNYAITGSSTPENNNYGLYTFNTNDIATEYEDITTAQSALDMINIVPNPYYAYSGYETNQLDNRVKITNLPEKCTISIYSVNGTLIRQFTKDETKTSFDWDLKNHAGIPISGGLYLIHIKAEGIGEKTIKWFGVLRPVDLNAF